MFEPLVFGSIGQSSEGSFKQKRGANHIETDQNSLYQVVRRNLSSQPCLMHDEIIEYMLEGKLYCKICFQERLSNHSRQLSSDQFQKMIQFCHLKTITRYPIIALAESKTILQYPQKLIHLMLKSYQPLFPKKNFLTAQRQLLQSFTHRIKKRVNDLCDQLLDSFSGEQANFEQINSFKEDSKNINKVYEQQFLQLLGEKYKQGNKAQLEEIFQNFKLDNQNPFTKITSNLDEIMSHLSLIPNINSKILADIYTTVTDQKIWRINQIITKRGNSQNIFSNQAPPMLSGQQISLQKQYLLETSEGKTLLKKSNELLGQLNTSFDSIYLLKKYKLACVNYQSIQILNYFDKLEVQTIFDIQGCTDLLVFDDILLILSNQNVFKLNLTSKSLVLILENIQQIKRHKLKPFTVTCLSDQQKQYQINIYEQQRQNASKRFA